MKVASDDIIHKHGFHSTTLLPVNTEFDMYYTPDSQESTTKEEKFEERLNLDPLKKFSQESANEGNSSGNDDTSFRFQRRALKSIEINADYHEDIFQDSKDEIEYKNKHKAIVKRNSESIGKEIVGVVTQENSNMHVSTSSYDQNEPNISNITENLYPKNDSIIEIKVTNTTEEINTDVKQNVTKNTVMDASEFFMLLSNWFSNLSNLANETGTLIDSR